VGAAGSPLPGASSWIRRPTVPGAGATESGAWGRGDDHLGLGVRSVVWAGRLLLCLNDDARVAVGRRLDGPGNGYSSLGFMGTPRFQGFAT